MRIVFYIVILAFSLSMFNCTQRATPVIPAATGAAPVSVPVPWEEAWEKVLRGAKNEGKVVIYSSFGGMLASVKQKAFKEKYGVEAEFVGGTGGELAQKILTERKNDLYLADIFEESAAGMITILKPAKVLDPLEQELILPEVVNPKMWLGGTLESLEFVDRDRTIFSYQAYAFPSILYNTNLFKPEDIKSYHDFLTPKWKRNIAMADPTTPGAGSYWFAATLAVLGIDFMRELAKQEPVIVPDRRMLVEWVAQGKYPVGIAAQSDQVAVFQKDGAPIKRHIPAEGTFRTSGGGNVALINRAPHRNAAKLFLNWFLSKEGQTLHTKTALQLSARVDVTQENIDPLTFVKPGIKYVNTDEAFFLEHSEKLKIAKEVFGSLTK